LQKVPSFFTCLHPLTVQNKSLPLFGTVEKEPMLVAVGQGLGYRSDKGHPEQI